MALGSRFRLAAVLVFTIAWLMALPAGATSPAATPADDCVEVDHFPVEPIGNSLSKAILYCTVPAKFGGWQIAVVVDGASGEVEGVGAVADDGLGIVEVPLIAYGAHEVDDPRMSLGAEVVGVELLPGGFTIDAAEPVCDPDSLVRAASIPTTSGVTTTNVAPGTATPPPPTTTASTTTTSVGISDLPSGGEVGTIPWGWIGLGVGLPWLLFGLWLLAGPGRDCERLRREWETLQRRNGEIGEAFAKAVAYLEERRASRAEVEAETAEIERTASMGGFDEGSTRFRLLPEGEVTDEGYHEILGTARERLDSAREGERMAEESVETWRSQLEDAAAKTDAARRAYEECVGEAVAGLTPTSEGSTTTLAPMIATTSARALVEVEQANLPGPARDPSADGRRGGGGRSVGERVGHRRSGWRSATL